MCLFPLDLSRLEVRNAHVYALPGAGPESVKGLKFLRWGLYLGELKKNRFEPSQPLGYDSVLPGIIPGS